MSDVRRTAMGDLIDLDMLRLANEETIAIGNAKTNARGDLLGSGGKVIKTRAQLMQEHHNMHGVLASDDDIYENEQIAQSNKIAETQPATPMLQKPAQEIAIAENESIPNYTKPRGSFADSVAKQTEVTQELLDPAPSRNGPKGIQRI